VTTLSLAHSPPGPLGEPLLTVEDICSHFRVSRSTAVLWARQGKLPPPRRIGRRMLWDRDRILALLADREG
jgi:excisionase family DNA binding protein